MAAREARVLRGMTFTTFEYFGAYTVVVSLHALGRSYERLIMHVLTMVVRWRVGRCAGCCVVGESPIVSTCTRDFDILYRAVCVLFGAKARMIAR